MRGGGGVGSFSIPAMQGLLMILAVCIESV